jgi:hypothetical protein
VPSAFPSTTFELTWTLSTLLKAGFDLGVNSSISTQKTVSYLQKTFTDGKGIVGFAPHTGADADDTAKTILVLSLLQSPVSLQPMLEKFETENHFKTYLHERNPSFSANCNVLIALLHAENPSQYSAQIEKAASFLHRHFRECSNLEVRDKWVRFRIH